MAQPIKINLTMIGAAAGALLACGALGAAGLAFLDWRIIHVVETREREKSLAELCSEELQGDSEKDRYIIQAREALGGCS
jgi:predicted MarR family transcription regulator